MIDTALYVEPAWLDPAYQRNLKIGELTDFSIASRMHSAYLTATEFPQASVELPIVFIATGERDATGRATVSPIVLLGLVPGENLQVEGTRWDARYIPASIRRYPFFSSGTSNAAPARVFVDKAWSGLSETVGEPLFEADNQPAPALLRVMDFLQRFEQEAQRTRAYCARVTELGLLKEMKADVTLGNGETLTVDGFQVVDEEKVQTLPDAVVLELHRNGMLMLLQLHLLSLTNMRHMVDRKWRRVQREAANAAG